MNNTVQFSLKISGIIIIGACMSCTPTTFYTPSYERPQTQQVIPFKPTTEKHGFYHTVMTGESVASVARLYGVSAKKISEYNRLPNPEIIENGQMLYIPDGDEK